MSIFFFIFQGNIFNFYATIYSLLIYDILNHIIKVHISRIRLENALDIPIF